MSNLLPLYSKKEIKLSILFAVLFCLNPFVLTIILLITFLLPLSKLDNNFITSVLSVILPLLIALINITKEPTSDLERYIAKYMSADQYASILEYVNTYIKDSGYAIMAYTFNVIFDKTFAPLLFTIIFISYYYSLKSILLFHKHQGSSSEVQLFSILTFVFFPSTFLISAHLIRQFLAGSLILFYVINRIYEKKNKWFYLLIAFFFHGSALLFLLLINIKILRTKINKYQLLIWSIIIALVFSYYTNIFSLILSYFPNIPIVSYIFSRLSVRMTDASSGSIGFLGIFFLVTYLLIFVLYGYILKMRNIDNIWFLNVVFGLSIFILLTIDQPLLSLRVYFYTYFFMALMLGLGLNLLKGNEGLRIILVLLYKTIIILLFCYAIQNGSFKYLDVSNLIKGNIFTFLSNKAF